MRAVIIVATGLLVLTSSGVAAATLSVPQQFPTIQTAVDAAAPGDTVLVGPGHYVENVLVQKSLTLRSTDGAALTTIDGNGIGAPLAAWGTLTEHVTISGFTLIGGAFLLNSVEVGYPNQWGAGLFIDSVATATVFDNVVTGNRGCGGTGFRSFESNIRFYDNVVRANHPMEWCPNNGEALRLNGSNELTASRYAVINRNEISGNGGVGVSLFAFDNVVVRGNTIADNGNNLEPTPSGGGMEIQFVGGVIADNLVARNFNFDAPAMRVQNFDAPVYRLLVTGNRFVDNHGPGRAGGVALGAFAPSTVYFIGNQVLGDSAGILVACEWGTPFVLGNLVVNRNPAGVATDCRR